MVYIIHKVVPTFPKQADVPKVQRNLRKGVMIEIFPRLDSYIPSRLVRFCTFWYCNSCFKVDRDPVSSYARLCPGCRRRMKLSSLRWGSKIRVYHTKYILNRKTGKPYKRKDGKNKCTPLKKVFDGRIFLFYDAIVSKIEEWKEIKERKSQ